jgi:hypothetical protein
MKVTNTIVAVIVLLMPHIVKVVAGVSGISGESSGRLMRVGLRDEEGQENSGASKALVSVKLWCQQGSDARKALVPAKLWCQQSSGARKVLIFLVAGTCRSYTSLAPALLQRLSFSSAFPSPAPFPLASLGRKNLGPKI